ncbi:MAG: hypothetical protein MJZ34_16745 [Paludibacteraceae bacterium]|nr:hypothetical protein [Paludibacteraceae bacterium]
MKANELMIFDWVMLDGIPKRLTLWDIVRISRGVYTTEPIPLTEDILMANGFAIVQDGDSLTIWKQKDDEYGNEVYDITIYGSKGVTRYDTSIRCHGTIRKNIKFVHELQQALRVCGLNDLADNFKVPA